MADDKDSDKWGRPPDGVTEMRSKNSKHYEAGASDDVIIVRTGDGVIVERGRDVSSNQQPPSTAEGDG